MRHITKSRQPPKNKKPGADIQAKVDSVTPGQAEAKPAAPGEAKTESGAPGQVKAVSAAPLPIKVSLEKRIQLLNQAIRSMPDEKKIKPLKELAFIGGPDSLKYILPLSQYSSGFLRKLASNAVIKIILRFLRDNEENPVFVLEQKEKMIDYLISLDRRYLFLKEMSLSAPDANKKILDILIQDDKSFSVRGLAEIISNSEEKIRATAVKLIAEMIEEKETSLLLKLLNDPDDRVRANVIESLEAIGNRNVLGILMKFKRDKNNRVRGNTLKALWNLGYRDIQDSLMDMLLDQDPKMRASAVWVISEIGHNQPALKGLLGTVKSDQDEMVRDNIRLAERKIGWREKGLRVQVVDDDKNFLQDFFRKLARDGFHIFASFDGKAAIDAATTRKPDIILLNLRLPVMNGLEVLQALKNQDATRLIPVVVMCDFNSSVLIKKAGEAGANDYLVKPFSYEEFKDKIQQFI